MHKDDFYSLDRLLEFGLEMTVANQMLQVMNRTMRNMDIPGSVNTIPSPERKPLYLVLEGKAVGPLTDTEFLGLVNTRQISKDTLAWSPGMVGWKPIAQLPELLKRIALLPPPIPTSL